VVVYGDNVDFLYRISFPTIKVMALPFLLAALLLIPPPDLRGQSPDLSVFDPPPMLPPLDASRRDAFKAYLNREWSRNNLPGMAVIIVQRENLILIECYGQADLDKNRPVTAETVFNLGHAGQGLVSLLTATLIYQNKADWDRPVRQLWSGFRMKDREAEAAVSLRDLLSMTAGIPETSEERLKTLWARPSDVFEVIAQSTSLAQPGSTFSYSPISYAAGGYLSAIAAGYASQDLTTGFESSMHHNVFQPLGMKQATFSRIKALSDGQLTQGYRRTDNSWAAQASMEVERDYLAPVRGLKASANDIAQWLLLEVNRGRLPGESRIAEERDITMRWQPPRVRDSRQFALGWYRQFHEGTEIVAHRGTYEHQTTLVAIMPRFHTALAVIINTDDRQAEMMAEDILLSLADMLREIKRSIPQPELLPPPRQY
jgi:putative ATP-binding cassette transporter